MDAELRPIEDILKKYSFSAGYQSSKLAELSSLTLEEVDILKNVWTTIAAEERRKVVGQLVELVEDNIEFNFDNIFRMCLQDEDAEVRRLAIDGLWENEEPSLIRPLLEILANDPIEHVRAASASALGRFTLLGEQGKLRPMYLPRLTIGLLSAVGSESENEEVRRRALEALAPLSIPEVRLAIQSAYNSRIARLKVSSVYAMGRSYDIAWLPTLLKELDSDDDEMRFEVVNALGELGEESAVLRLIELADDPDPEVRMAVRQALGKIGGRKAKEYLQRSLSSNEQAIRDATEQALGELKAMEDPLSLQLQ